MDKLALIIPRKLRALVENYISTGNRKKEMGGFFFGEDENVNAFMPMPNYAESPYNTYNYGNTEGIAKHFARMVDGKIIADMHTHPDGTIPSGTDKNYVKGMSWKFHIIIADKGGNTFEWFAVNRSLQSVAVVYSDVELTAYGELLAREIGLKSLGRVFISPSGELLGKEYAKRILSVDTDVHQLLEWEKTLQWRDQRTMARAQRELNFSPTRAKKAFTRLGWR